MKIILTGVLSGILLLLPVPEGRAAELSAALMPAFQEGRTVYRNKESGKIRGEFSYNLQRTQDDKRTLYVSRKEGRGDYAGYTDVVWTIDSRMQEESDRLNPLESSLTIKTGDGNVLTRYEIVFQHDRKIINFRRFDGAGELIRAADFPIKGPTTDSFGLIHFLKKLVAEPDKKKDDSFYLLTNEPALYKIDLKRRGEEKITLPAGEFRAVKIQLLVDLGPLTGITARLFPPTYLWYQKNDPSLWLRYEGLEFGRNSTNIISYMAEMRRPGLSFR